MKGFTAIILIIVICFGLYITNPTRGEFEAFIEDEMRQELNSSTDSISSLISGMVASITGKAAATMSTREDYFLFSIYTVKIVDEEYKYIGIFKKFRPLIQ